MAMVSSTYDKWKGTYIYVSSISKVTSPEMAQPQGILAYLSNKKKSSKF